MASHLRNIVLKSCTGNVIIRNEMRRAKSDTTTKMQIMIKSFESIDKNLHWELPPETRKIGLPSTRSLFTVNKSPHVHKKARDQFQLKINKEMLVMETKRHELSKKLFWLKRQRIFGSQFEIMFSFKTRLDKDELQQILHQSSEPKDVAKDDKVEE
ncbi:small ribosomal subunit protein uS10m-like [Rutidosis leptorrhynchoides]|uniref:small ribosomal subunit protein uS10m-like n=1 Tax=Rutidosis leptorrhynchoides TaxID=125765 RepID=UPI003A992F03